MLQKRQIQNASSVLKQIRIESPVTAEDSRVDRVRTQGGGN